MKTRVCRLYGQNDLRIEEIPLEGPARGDLLIAVGAGGICGSDQHYYSQGGIGVIRVREPIILGHEAAGTVVEVGEGVDGFAVGDRVAMNPSHPCGTCKYCAQGMFNHCLEMRFKGSAARIPHEQGFFRDRMAIKAGQCHKVADGISIGEAACSEPLSVCVHAYARAGDIKGKSVLVTGSGPIGALCAALAAKAGAAEVVVTDLEDAPLSVAAQMGATETINVARNSARMKDFTVDKGHFDVCFECTAAEPAIRSAIDALHPCGILVQVGVSGDLSLPINHIVAKEIDIRGTHRFHPEFTNAVSLINTRAINLRPMITHTFPLVDADEAIRIAGDRTVAVKVQLAFAGE